MMNGQPVCGTFLMFYFFVDVDHVSVHTGCIYNGVGYNATSRFPAGDGCNHWYAICVLRDRL